MCIRTTGVQPKFQVVQSRFYPINYTIFLRRPARPTPHLGPPWVINHTNY
ncbi:hypothetical protein Hanom_Chr16g01511801 [Helianthus anomalus]